MRYPQILSFVFLALLMSCKSQGSKDGKEAGSKSTDVNVKESKTNKKANDSLSSLGGPGLFAIQQMLSELDSPGIYGALKQSADFSNDKPHLLVFNLSGAITELNTMSLWGGSTSTGLRVLQERFRMLATNENLQGLLLRVDGLSIGFAAAEELRQYLQLFKDGGKRKLYCHTEGVSNISYYLMAACDSIAMAPTGQVAITGVSAMPLHLKGLLDKLGVKADFLHVGDYKGAAEPITLDKPSAAMKETIGSILDQKYATLVDGIAAGRSLPVEKVKELIDTAIFSSQEALKASLIDKEATYETYLANTVGTSLGWKKVGLVEKTKGAEMSKLMNIIGLTPQSRSSKDHIALVYAVGNIIDGGGKGVLGAREEIASRTLVAALRSVAKADSVKAVVLRVDSGGGSALASEIIWHAVNELKSKKPVVVSMGGLAASGGYYISAGANRIFADENTLTGSIGVVGGKMAIGGALEKFGVRSFPIGRGKNSTLWNNLGPWNQEERALVQKMMEDIYKVFVTRVAAGRGKSYEEIHAIAQGRVWTGKAALANGLIDEIGGLDNAIGHAMLLAKMNSDAGVPEIYPPKPRLTDYISSFPGVTTKESLLLAEVNSLLGHKVSAVIRKTLEQFSSFRDSALQTTLIMPVHWQ